MKSIWGWCEIRMKTLNELALTIHNRSLHEIGIYQLPDTFVVFKVQELTKKKMTLRLGEDSIYYFRKFGN